MRCCCTPRHFITTSAVTSSPMWWEVVAAESPGLGVAVLVGGPRLLVCTSPAFNSKCSHPGLPCLDWDTVPLDTAQDISTVIPAAELVTERSHVSPDTCSHVMSQDTTCHIDQWSQGAVELQSPINFNRSYNCSDPVPGAEQHGSLHPRVRRGGCGNAPLVRFHGTGANVGMDSARLGLHNNSASCDGCSRVGQYEQQLRRKEFKNTLLFNCGLIQEQSDEEKIRHEFKKQILSNLDKKNF